MFASILKYMFFRAKDRKPSVLSARNESKNVAIVFVHGFTGSAKATWAALVQEVLKSEAVKNWDIYYVNYSTSLRIDIPHVWSADPPLELLSNYLKTLCSSEPLSRYKRLALVSHSMGGLIVQKAIVDNAALTSRLSHVMLFGTPSGGLYKASLSRSLKRQLRDMGSESQFILELRKAWALRFVEETPFRFCVVAGESDVFVPASSSLFPFKHCHRQVVQGNHLTMLSATQSDVDAPQLLIEFLCDGLQRSAIDSARLVVETGNFREAVNQLLPNVDNLDTNALAILALALETLGRKDEALDVLEKNYNKEKSMKTTDALGVLAGRVKRRWLSQRSADDLERALSLYSDGYALAAADNDHSQCFYHAINISFLKLMSCPPNSLPGAAIDFAKKALEHCAASPETPWRIATEAEAHLIIGNIEASVQSYKAAINLSSSPREIQSMYSQAINICGAKDDDAVTNTITSVFFPSSK